jgi:L-amino acid N-acyltransferase YncA
MLRFLRERKAEGVREIYVTRDSSYSTSEALLQRLGFKKTDETYEDKEVWKWQA